MLSRTDLQPVTSPRRSDHHELGQCPGWHLGANARDVGAVREDEGGWKISCSPLAARLLRAKRSRLPFHALLVDLRHEVLTWEDTETFAGATGPDGWPRSVRGRAAVSRACSFSLASASPARRRSMAQTSKRQSSGRLDLAALTSTCERIRLPPIRSEFSVCGHYFHRERLLRGRNAALARELLPMPSDVNGRASLGSPLSMGELGRALRQLRHSSGDSLANVAAAVGLSASFLSLVETGKSDISLNRLHKLAGHYGVGVADLLPSPEPRDPAVVGPGDRRAIELKAEGLTQYLLAPDAHRTMLPLLVCYEPGGGADRHKHRGEEFVHILSGQLILDLEDAADVVLNPGDSVYFNSERAHALRSSSEAQTWALAVITPPTW